MGWLVRVVHLDSRESGEQVIAATDAGSAEPRQRILAVFDALGDEQVQAQHCRGCPVSNAAVWQHSGTRWLDMASIACQSGAMDLRLYVENLQRQLAVAAEAGGNEARALAERLIAPLDAAIRLTLLDVLASAAEEITCELAPGAVEVRLRGRDPEFVVMPAPVDVSVDDLAYGDDDTSPNSRPVRGVALPASVEGDEGAMSRINLRMPDQFKVRIEHAAASEGLSVNAWLVRAAAAALERNDPGRRRERRAPQGAQRYTGWAR